MANASALPPKIAERFVKVAGLPGSSHDGEIYNAARQAIHILREHGMMWQDPLRPMMTTPPLLKAKRVPKPAADNDWRAAPVECAGYPSGLLTPWELAFLGSILCFKSLNSKQATLFARLQERLRAAARAAS